ncbi:hypothetical protein [Nonomuraea fuscirosea]|uniref:hypothetical protein n=1 Tax=Nonomuraea fuscirosea TaxID=1291556 RepID=UPI00343E6FA5
MKESVRHPVTCPTNQVLLSRQHSGDESGPTRYGTAAMSPWGRTVELTSHRWTAGQRESSSHSKRGISTPIARVGTPLRQIHGLQFVDQRHPSRV